MSWSTSSAARRCAGSTFAVTVDMKGASGSVKRTLSSAGRSRSAARATSGLWNAPETLSWIARRAPRLSASAQHSSTASCSPEIDDLARAVVVRRPDADDLPAELLDLLVLEPEDRGHRAWTLARGLRHRQPPLAHEPYRLAGPERAGRRERGELADRVADDDVGLESALPHRGENRQARRDERRLLHLGLDEILERRLEAELLEIEAGGLRADAVHLPGDGERFCDVPAHAHLERPLSGETERDLAHRGLPFVHSIRAEPQVSPAPIPVIRTSAPSRSRPSARASVSASGIEPDEVLP